MRLSGKQSWSAIAILTQEVGRFALHQKYGSSEEERHRQELEADEFVGLVWGRLNAPWDEAIYFFRSFSTAKEPSHPGFPSQEERVAAIRAGWNKGRPLHVRLRERIQILVEATTRSVESVGKGVGGLTALVTAIFGIRTWWFKKQRARRGRRRAGS